MSAATLTEDERNVLDLSAQLWNHYCLLTDRPRQDDEDMLRLVHELQRIIGTRVARRADPEVWR